MAVPFGFPDETDTGVPSGTALTVYNGTFYVTEDNAVISGMEIRGNVVVEADNVTIQNSKIISGTPWHAIYVIDGTGFTLKDSEIDGGGYTVNGVLGPGTFLRNDIHGVDNGINTWGNAGDPTLIQDNYIHDLQGGSDAHYDGIEINGGSHIRIIHNTIINDHNQTAAIMLNNEFGGLSNITIDDNYLVGGGYTIYLDGRKGGGTVNDSSIAITNNEIVRGRWGYFSFYDDNPVQTGNTLYTTPPTEGGGGTPTPTATILSFSSDSGALGDGITNDNTLSLSGTATANSTVKVFDGTTQLGWVTANGSGAWSFATAALADGNYSFNATATSGSTTSPASAALSVRVDTVAPSAPTIASFSSDTGTVGDGITADNTLMLTGTATANRAVKVYDGETLLGTVTANGSGAWNYSTGTLADGIHNFMARATDVAGNTSVASSILAITVDRTGSEPTPITGTGGDDVLKGTSAADILMGYAGNDIYTVNSPADQVVELANEGIDKVESTISYTLADNVENLQLLGDAQINGAGNDLSNIIIGNDVSNTIEGHASNDTLNGWGGKDTFFGGSGNDIFQFSSQFSADGDKVMDFIHGVDKLDFSKIDASLYRLGDQAFTFDGYDGGGSNRHLWAVEDQAAGITHLYGKTGNFQFHIELQGAHLGLTTSDFIL